MSPNLILVVDDDAAILELIAQVLNEEGYRTITANGGRSAIAQARARLPRLIVLDMMMPEVNGWQVITELRTFPQTRAIPIILLSAQRDLSAIAAGLGGIDYLEKPFDIDDLVGRVQKYFPTDTYRSP